MSNKLYGWWDSNPHTPITLLMTVYKTVTIHPYYVEVSGFEPEMQHPKCCVLTCLHHTSIFVVQAGFEPAHSFGITQFKCVGSTSSPIEPSNDRH